MRWSQALDRQHRTAEPVATATRRDGLYVQVEIEIVGVLRGIKGLRCEVVGT